MSSNTKNMVEFTISKSEFDESNYIGRMRAFRKTCNPMLAFFSNTKIE